MTIKELSQLKYLNTEISVHEETLREMRRNNTDTAVIEAVENALTRCKAEKHRLEKFIYSIPNSDSRTRQIFILRFIRNLSWVQISFRVGGDCTADGVRKVCTRYLEKIKNF